VDGLARNRKTEIQICISTKLQIRNNQPANHINMFLKRPLE
jgi:hypothetical protein